MPDQELKVVVSMVDKITSKLKKTQEGLKGFSENAKKVGTAMTVAGGAIAAVGVTSVKAFQEQERAEARLNQIATKVTGSTQEQISAFKEQASALQELGVIGDENIIAGQSQIASFTKSSEVVSELTDDIADLAVAQFGANVSQDNMIQTGNLLGKALQGQLGALTRTGILVSDDFKKAFEEANTEQERAVVISQIVQDNYGGLNAAMRDTAEGGMQALKNSFGDLQEKIGGAIVPALNNLVEKIQPVIDNIIKWTQENPELFNTIVKVTVAVGGVLLVLGPLLLALSKLPTIIGTVSAALTIMTGPVGLVLAAIGLLVAAGITLVQNWDTIKQKVTEFIDKHEGLKQALEVARNLIRQVANIVKEKFQKAWDDLMVAIEPHKEEFKKLALLLGGALLLALGAVALSIGTVVVGIGALLFIGLKLITWVLKAKEALNNFGKNALDFINDKLNSVGDALGNVAGALINLAGNALNSINTFVNNIGNGLSGLIQRAIEWGQHMIDNFTQGIRNGINNMKASLGNVQDRIKEAIGFSTNPNIPTEIWGFHMMQNFAGGIDEGNEDVMAKLDETVAIAEERIADFTDTFATLRDKTREAWSDFKDATKDAKKTFRETMDDIKAKTKEVKQTFKQDFASAVLDIRDNIKSLQDQMSGASLGFDEKIAKEIVNARDSVTKLTDELNEELSKAEDEQDVGKVDSLKASLAEQEAFLAKHSETAKMLGDVIAEEERIRNLDAVELLQEQKEKELGVIQEKINAEQAILDAHQTKITELNGQIVEAARVRGLNELEALIEGKNNELAQLQIQEDNAVEIRTKAMKKARKRLRKTLKGILKDTSAVVADMNKEFSSIPASIANSFADLSKSLVNFGSGVGVVPEGVGGGKGKKKGGKANANSGGDKNLNVTNNIFGGLTTEEELRKNNNNIAAVFTVL